MIISPLGEVFMHTNTELNPLIQRAQLPGDTVTLPSRGVFYTNGELDENVQNGELIVYPMVTIEEIYFKTPDKLLNGTAVIDVFKRCVPQVKQPLELMVKDVDFLIMQLRRVTYGDEYEILVTHDCSEAKEHSYIVNLANIIRNSIPIEPTTVAQRFTLELPNGQVVCFHPTKYCDVLQYQQAAITENTNQTPEQNSKLIIDSIANVISSVDSYTDRAMIKEWLKQLPAGYVKQIIQKVDIESNWGIDQNTSVVCKDCNSSFNVQLPLNPINFFS